MAIGVDAVASPAGRSLPLSPRALTDLATFKRLLGDGGHGAHALRLRPESIVATTLESPSSNCRNTIFEVNSLKA